MFSTEEVTIAAMRRGRDGMSPSILSLQFSVNNKPRCHDVPLRCCRYDMFRLLLDVVRGRLQRMAQISYPSEGYLSQFRMNKSFIYFASIHFISLGFTIFPPSLILETLVSMPACCCFTTMLFASLLSTHLLPLNVNIAYSTHLYLYLISMLLTVLNDLSDFTISSMTKYFLDFIMTAVLTSIKYNHPTRPSISKILPIHILRSPSSNSAGC